MGRIGPVGGGFLRGEDLLRYLVFVVCSRRDLEIERPMPGAHTVTLQCPALLVVGDNSPAVDAVVECNSKLDPTKTTLLKMADCGGLPQISQVSSTVTPPQVEDMCLCDLYCLF
ncbi:hypothetical protein MC885_008537, partial [Smutsia gigantea]